MAQIKILNIYDWQIDAIDTDNLDLENKKAVAKLVERVMDSVKEANESSATETERRRTGWRKAGYDV